MRPGHAGIQGSTPQHFERHLVLLVGKTFTVQREWLENCVNMSPDSRRVQSV